MKGLISIVIPVYNAQLYLDECIQSVIGQTHSQLEIILVDDESTDNSSAICDEWAKKDSRIKVIHQKNTGPAEARKNGILQSTGEYLYFVDSDDYIDERLCEKALEIFQKNDVEIVTFDWTPVGLKKGELPKSENIKETVLGREEAVTELIKTNINNYFWNKMYKRHVFDGVDFLEQRVWEDMGAMYRIFLNANRIYCLPEKLYYYRMHGESIIHTIGDKALEDIFYVQMKRYVDLSKAYPHIAEIAFRRIPWAAIRLYDRSLWGNIDKELLNRALSFLADNKEKVLCLEDKKRFVWFYKNRKLYDLFRKTVHKVGNIVKKLR